MSEKNKPAKALSTLRRALALNLRLRMKRGKALAALILAANMLPGILEALTVPALEGILAFANKAASITTSRHGAIPAMPTLEEMER